MLGFWWRSLPVAIVLTVPINSADAASFMRTGNDFVAECPLDGQVYRVCMAYVLAIGESLRLQDQLGRHPLCVPNDNTAQQLYDVVAKDLQG